MIIWCLLFTYIHENFLLLVICNILRFPRRTIYPKCCWFYLSLFAVSAMLEFHLLSNLYLCILKPDNLDKFYGKYSILFKLLSIVLDIFISQLYLTWPTRRIHCLRALPFWWELNLRIFRVFILWIFCKMIEIYLNTVQSGYFRNSVNSGRWLWSLRSPLYLHCIFKANS